MGESVKEGGHLVAKMGVVARVAWQPAIVAALTTPPLHSLARPHDRARIRLRPGARSANDLRPEAGE